MFYFVKLSRLRHLASFEDVTTPIMFSQVHEIYIVVEYIKLHNTGPALVFRGEGGVGITI